MTLEMSAMTLATAGARLRYEALESVRPRLSNSAARSRARPGFPDSAADADLRATVRQNSPLDPLVLIKRLLSR
jgi:hypothetical protein